MPSTLARFPKIAVSLLPWLLFWLVVVHIPSQRYRLPELFEPTLRGNTPEVARLIAEGADVNARAPTGGMPVLLWAVMFGHTDGARLLLGAGADPLAADCSGDTPLSAATLRNHAALVDLLSGGAGHAVPYDGPDCRPLSQAAWLKYWGDRHGVRMSEAIWGRLYESSFAFLFMPCPLLFLIAACSGDRALALGALLIPFVVIGWFLVMLAGLTSQVP